MCACVCMFLCLCVPQCQRNDQSLDFHTLCYLPRHLRHANRKGIVSQTPRWDHGLSYLILRMPEHPLHQPSDMLIVVARQRGSTPAPRTRPIITSRHIPSQSQISPASHENKASKQARREMCEWVTSGISAIISNYLIHRK